MIQDLELAQVALGRKLAGHNSISTLQSFVWVCCLETTPLDANQRLQLQHEPDLVGNLPLEAAVQNTLSSYVWYNPSNETKACQAFINNGEVAGPVIHSPL